MYINSHLHRRRTIILVALLTGAGYSGRLAAQVGLGLAPMRQELPIAPGSQQSGALTLTNNAPAKTRLRVELLDFFIDQQATPQFGRALPSEADYSCRQWLSLNPMEAELDAGGKLLVRYTIRVPASAPARSYYCAAGFTTLPTAEHASGIGLKTAVRIVTTFYVIVGDPAVEGEIKDIKLEHTKTANPAGGRAVVLIQNRGFRYFRPEGSLEVLDGAGQVVESAPFPSIPILPKRDQPFLFPLRTPVQDGRFTLRARVRLGNGEIQEATAVVEAKTP